MTCKWSLKYIYSTVSACDKVISPDLGKQPLRAGDWLTINTSIKNKTCKIKLVNPNRVLYKFQIRFFRFQSSNSSTTCEEGNQLFMNYTNSFTHPPFRHGPFCESAPPQMKMLNLHEDVSFTFDGIFTIDLYYELTKFDGK